MRIVLRKLAAAALALCLLAPGAVNVGASEASVGIVSVASNSLMFTERTYITFTVVTNANAKFVYIEYDGLIHRVENMATDPAGFYVWTARCMLSKPQEIVVYANSVDSVHGAQTRSLKIIESFLHSVEMDNEEYHKGDTVRITVKTNEKAEHVWVRYNDGTFKKGSLKSANPDGERTWTIDIKPEGTQTVRVSANTIYSYGGAASVERDVLFSEPVATVNGLRLSRANVPEGEYVTVTITTNVAATQVWVKHDDTTTDARLTRTTKSSKTWSATIRPEKTQTLSVYANVTKSETGASKKTISLSVVEKRAAIVSAEAERTFGQDSWGNYTNDRIEMTVVTTSIAENVWAEVGLNQTVSFTLKSTNSLNGNKTWTAAFTPAAGNANVTQVTVCAGRKANVADDTRRINVVVTAKILSFYVERNSVVVGAGSKFALYVVTNAAVDDVLVYDDFFNMAIKSDPTFINNRTQKLWSFTVTPLDSRYKTGDVARFTAVAISRFVETDSKVLALTVGAGAVPLR